MHFQVLGPIEIKSRDRRIRPGSPKEQAVLAALLMEAGFPVSAQSLADRIWDEQPPQRERSDLQVLVSRLRGRLREAGDTVGVLQASRAGGYLLNVPPDTVDARRFERLVAQARDLAKSEPETARTLLLEAEALWNGEPLAGLPGQWAHGIRTKLLERRRLATLDRIDLDLRVGRHDDALSELSALTAGARPIDEHVVGLKLRALAALGRRVEALEEFRRVRARLHDEIGTEPGPNLQTIFQRILNGDRTDGSVGGIRMSDEDAPPPDTLDRDPPLLVGRDADLASLLATVERDLRSRSGIALYSIDGMFGIGKTALAVRAAHMLREVCPDGQLQINLHAYRQPRLSPREALTQLLDSIGVSPRELGRAGSVDALAALWRRRIKGKRLLVLLDDVWDADQIEPLLPTTPGCVVLMTSRNRLMDVAGLRQRTLNVLPDEATLTLLNEITGRDFSGHDDDLTRFSARCGGLPLAIKVFAGRLDRRPTWTLHDLLARLATSGPGPAEDGMTAKSTKPSQTPTMRCRTNSARSCAGWPPTRDQT